MYLSQTSIVQVLVGNKTDLIEEEKVQYDEANSYAKVSSKYIKVNRSNAQTNQLQREQRYK